MTLHWWMHWFWVTLRLYNVVTGVPLSTNGITIATTEASMSQELSYTSRDSIFLKDIASSASSSLALKLENLRVPKAIGINPSEKVSESSRETRNNGTNRKTIDDQDSNVTNIKISRSNNNDRIIGDKQSELSNKTVSSSAIDDKRKDSRSTWIFTRNETDSSDNKLSKIDDEPGDERRNTSFGNENERQDLHRDPLAVLPLDEPMPTRFKLILNRTKFIPSTNVNDDKVFVEPKILATPASVLQGTTESPRLSRARSAFPGDYQQDEQEKQERQERKQEKPLDNFVNSTTSAVDIAAVTGSCLATLVLIGTTASLGFVMYRRRYSNPPQTLNSDKCSNPDSSGYIDDSTIRDNSEEMYSLDNDSFLNSLEAMTIQNYWTDSVKHTKL